MWNAVGQLLLTAVGGAIGAAVAFYLGLRQFKSQKWWDRTAEAYISLLDAFHPLLDEDTAYWDAEIDGKDLAEPRKLALREASAKAEAEIYKRKRMASFLIDPRADEALNLMFRDLEKSKMTTDWIEYRQAESDALWKGFSAVKSIAAEHLGVASSGRLLKIFGGRQNK